MKKCFTKSSDVVHARAFRTALLAALCVFSTTATAESQTAIKHAHPALEMLDIKTPTPPETHVALMPEGASRRVSAPASSPRAPRAKLPDNGSSNFAIDRDRIYFDQRDDALWVRGKNWKASFARSGMSFIPFFGSRAPHDYPITFSLDDVLSSAAPIEIELARNLL